MKNHKPTNTYKAYKKFRQYFVTFTNIFTYGGGGRGVLLGKHVSHFFGKISWHDAFFCLGVDLLLKSWPPDGAAD